MEIGLILGAIALLGGSCYLIYRLTTPKGHYAQVIRLKPREKPKPPKPQVNPPSKPEKPPSGPSKGPDIHDREPKKPVKPTLSGSAENEPETQEPVAAPVSKKVIDLDQT